jgi:hypothetical protein
MTEDTRRILPGTPAQAPLPPPPAFAALASNGTEDSPLVELPDGRRVVLGRPNGSVIALVVKITAELTRGMKVGDEPQLVAMSYLEPYVKALLHVRSIEGKPTIPVSNAETYQTLADNLSDDGINEIQRAILEHWPPPSAEHRAEIKKNRTRPDLS